MTDLNAATGASGVPVDALPVEPAAASAPLSSGSPRAHGDGRRSASSDGLPQRFGRNVGMNYVAAAVQALAALIVTPLLLHHLGTAAFGVWVLAVSLTSYLQLLEFGFGAATTKVVAEDGHRRPERVVETLNTTFAILSGFAVVALIVAGVLAVGAPAWFSIPPDLESEARIALLVMGVALAVSIPCNSFGGALAGHQRYDMLSGSNAIYVTALTAVTVAVLLLGGGIVPLAIATAALGVASHVLRWGMLRRVVPRLRLSPRLVDRSRIRSLASLSGWFLLSQAAVMMILRIDLVVVGATLDIEAVAVFAVGSKLAQFALRTFRQMSTVFMPHATSLFHGGQEHRLRDVVVDGTRVTLATAVPFLVVLTILAGPVIDAWVGPGFQESAEVLTILAVAVSVGALMEPTFAMLTASGRVRIMAMSFGVEAVVNLVASVTLALMIGVHGVALGTLIGVVAVRGPVLVWIALPLLGLRARDFFAGAIAPHVVPALIAALPVVIVRLAGGGGVAPVVGTALVSGFVYFAAYYRLGATQGDRERVRAGVRAVVGVLSRRRTIDLREGVA